MDFSILKKLVQTNEQIDVDFWISTKQKEELLCDYIMINGDVELLNWSLDKGVIFEHWRTERIAGYGHLELLKRVREINPRFSVLVCFFAAANNHLHILKWMRESGMYIGDYVINCAIRDNYTEMLEWARSINAPTNADTYYLSRQTAK
jgi:hypothetical protein